MLVSATLLLGAGCDDELDSAEPDTIDEATGVTVEAELTDIATVVRITWSTQQDSTGYVSFSHEDYQAQTPSDGPATEHEALLLGLPANSDVTYQVCLDEDGGEVCGEERTTTTGSLPAELPEITLATADAALQSNSFVSVTLLSGDHLGYNLAILDGQGRYVWYFAGDPPPTRTLFSADKQWVMFNQNATSAEANGQVVRAAMDGSSMEMVSVPGAHTDFAELPDGTLASLSWDIQEIVTETETRRVAGDRIVETSPDGESTEVWTIWDDMEPGEDERFGTGWYPDDKTVEDWTHANSISYDADQDAYFVTFFQFDGLCKVDRASGTMAWMLSPEFEDFQSTDTDYPVSNPHSAKAIGDDLLVLNRGWFEPDECSEAAEVSLDLEAGTTSKQWSYMTEDCLQNVALGEAYRLDNGNTFVIWSSSGQMDEVTSDGELVWRVNADLGTAFGFGLPFSSFY